MLPALLATRADRSPDTTCLVEAETSQTVTFAQLRDQALHMAAGLAELGVVAGDAVATMLPHTIDTYRLWFGLSQLGALEVPIGTKFRGRMLEHILRDSGARVLVVDALFADAVEQVLTSGEVPDLQTVVVRGDASATLSASRVISLQDVPTALADAALREPAAHELALVLYTSGTTGPSKGVLVPWGQVGATIEGMFPDGTFAPDSVVYGPFPPNHIGGRLFPGMGIQHGVPAVIRDAFSASSFWPDIARYGCTTSALVSAMVSILLTPPSSPDDQDNTLREVMMTPFVIGYDTFQTRFGVRACTDYNMTETSIPLHSGWDIEDWQSSGRVRSGYPGYELRVVDEHDYPVAPGVVGELICRTSEPWTMNAGYLGRPEETASAWRNGWFHTGDAFRYDEQGKYYFVDRMKDAIRRRGENVSSFEIEREVLDHPSVLECAAIGVPSELSEEDIKVFVVKRPGAELSEQELITHMRANCADFMVPRYVEFIDELPKTDATQKVMKAQLRARSER